MYRLFIILIILFVVPLFVWQGIYLPKNASFGEEIIFIIDKGEGAKEIASNLAKEDLVKSAFHFRLYVLLKGVSGLLKAGGYSISPSMTIPEIAEEFFSGESIKENITIIEGWNLKDIANYFENKGMFQREELYEITGLPVSMGHLRTSSLSESRDFSEDYNFLEGKPKSITLEGYLFPDTYEIDRGEGIENIVRRMLDNFDSKLTSDLREEVKRQEKSIFEIITIASLIEKEVRTIEDKKMVSGILQNRLEAGIPLQIDATVSYITDRKTTEISRDELKIDSPYNAYKYYGLPLGPICNPGIDSIKAAIYPTNNEYWYYLSTPEGETIFSKTLEEHNTAKAKYLK